MKYDPEKHHRRSTRLRGHDYTSPGAYFVTLNVQNRVHLFGEVIKGQMQLNGFGTYAQDCWMQIPNHFSGVELDEFVIMPNHIHGIIQISGNSSDVTRVQLVGVQHAAPRLVLPGSLGAVVRSYKSAITKKLNELWNTPGCRIWQKDYYDIIVRDPGDLQRIRQYIKNNPAKWQWDSENSKQPMQ